LKKTVGALIFIPFFMLGWVWGHIKIGFQVGVEFAGE